MRIPFDIKYRPEIESGKYKIETRDGRSVRIVCWDTLGEYPITALVKTGDKENCSTFTNSGAFIGDNEKQPSDLFIIPDEEELTEFDLELRYWIGQALCNYENNGCVSDNMTDSVEVYLKDASKNLLDLARKELLKDLPKWKYMRNGACGGGDRDCFLIRSCEGYYHTSTCIGPDTTYLELDKLEKLPKEK